MEDPEVTGAPPGVPDDDADGAAEPATQVDAIVLEAGSAVVVSVSESLLVWGGYSEDQVVGSPLWDTLGRDDVLGELLLGVHCEELPPALGLLEGPVTAQDGRTRPTRWAQVVVPGLEDQPARIVMTELGPPAGDLEADVAPEADVVPDDVVPDDVVPDDVEHPEVSEPAEPEEPSALDRVTRGLLDTLSHELRTPVASVLGYAELLREGEGGQLTVMQRKFVGAIARNSERLRGLADQLLLISGLESQSTQLDLQPLDLRSVVSSVRVSLAASGLERVEVALEPGEEELVVLADRHRLSQVVEELVINAAKFTLGNGQVTCRARRDDEHALIEVTDTGVGFGAEDEPSLLFLPFYRSRSVRVRGVPGAGLGLSFAAAVVQGHGGEIHAARRDEGGSVFTVRVPLAPAPEADPPSTGPSFEDLDEDW